MAKRFAVLLVVAVLVGLLPITAQAQNPPEPLIIGSIYITPPTEPWSKAHKDALETVLAEYAAKLDGQLIRENDTFKIVGKDGQVLVDTMAWTATDDFSSTAALRAAENMIKHGAKLIFITAENWCQDLTDTFAPAHPDTNFACIRSRDTKNVVSMYPQSWAGFCAACAAAATVVEKPILGLEGAYESNPQVASNHGACAACFAHAWKQLERPGEPVISKVYIDSWGDKGKETEAARALVDIGAQVIAVHQDSTSVAETVATDWLETGYPWVIGYDRNWRDFLDPKLSNHVLTSVVIDWSDVYRQSLEMTVNGKFIGFRWNPGFENGAITLAPFSPAAPDKAKQVADQYIKMLESGWRPCGTDEFMWSLDHWTKCYDNLTTK